MYHTPNFQISKYQEEKHGRMVGLWYLVFYRPPNIINFIVMIFEYLEIWRVASGLYDSDITAPHHTFYDIWIFENSKFPNIKIFRFMIFGNSEKSKYHRTPILPYFFSWYLDIWKFGVWYVMPKYHNFCCTPILWYLEICCVQISKYHKFF